MSGALACLAAWGAALGAGAETLNNVVILSVVPIASATLASGMIAMATAVFLVALGVGAAVTLYDAFVKRPRSQ